MKKIADFLIYAVAFVLFAWLVCSLIDTNLANDIASSHYQHFSSWNLFEIFFN